MSIQTKQPLTLKYRPQRFSDVYEQDAVKQILQYELQTGNIKRCLLFTGPAGCGKCLGKDTPVLMYDGTIKMVQDIQIGDQLMGPDSKPRNVLSTCTGTEQMYKIIPNRGGMAWSCNASHILSLKASYKPGRGKKYIKDNIYNIEVKDLVKRGKYIFKILKQYRVPVDFNSTQSLTIDPYIYGLWLGDGTTSKVELTNMDTEIVDYWCDYAKQLNLQIHIYDKDRCPRYALTQGNVGGKSNVFLDLVKESCMSGHKRILHQYKTANRQDRLKLLAGIIDTDGYKLPRSTSYEIVSKYEDLAQDYAFVARSLGFRCNIIKKKSLKFNEKYYDAYSVRISGDIKRIPVKLCRKKCDRDFKDGDCLKTGITIQDEGIGQYYGFTIDGDHLFMLGDFTVTHNTTSARIFAKEIESTVSNIIEINCADHTGIDDARQLIIEPSKSKPLVGAYKIFILDEVHMLTVQSQNALLKLFEEPPSFCIYIMCTTDPQKVLSTILSRCFRYDFQLISHQGIVNRLNYILTQEQQDPNGCGVQSWNIDALNFIALHSKGHMRNSIVTLEKSLAFDKHLTIQNVEKVLGVTGFEDMFKVLDSILNKQQDILLQSLDNIEKSGIDLKLFIKNFLQFVLDINKYIILKTECPNTLVQFTMIPPSYENRLQQYNVAHRQALKQLLQLLLQLNSLVRWETNVKPVLETNLLLEIL